MSIILKADVSAWEWARTIKASNAKDKNYPKWVIDSFTAAELKAGYVQNGLFYRPLYQVKHKAGLIDQIINTNSNHNIKGIAGTPAQDIEFVLVGYEPLHKLPIFDDDDDEQTSGERAETLRRTLLKEGA